MAFQNWVDDDKLSNILSAYYFTNDQQRQEGFKAGQVASAIRVNSGLRQANLVACALMDSLNITNADLTTSRSILASYITDGLNQGRSAITGNYIPKNNNQISLGSSSKYWKNVYGKSLYYGANKNVETEINNAVNRISSLESQPFVMGTLTLPSDARSGSYVNVFKMGKIVIASIHISITTITELTTSIASFPTTLFLPNDSYFTNAYEEGVSSPIIGCLNDETALSTTGQMYFNKEGTSYTIKGPINNHWYNGVLVWFTN